MKLVRPALREPKDGALEAHIGKREMTVTILTGSVEVEPIPRVGTFGTTVQELNRCLEWLLGNHCSRVVVESTGTYWVPVWKVLHRIEVLIDARLKPIRLGNQVIQFKTAAPSRLFWAGRPAMRVVQALHWLQDMLSKATERPRVIDHLRKILADPTHGPPIRDDLRTGLSALPIWMQDLVREVIADQRPDRAATGANK